MTEDDIKRFSGPIPPTASLRAVSPHLGIVTYSMSKLRYYDKGIQGMVQNAVGTIVVLHPLLSVNAEAEDMLNHHDSATWPSPPYGKSMYFVLRIEESMLPVTETENANIAVSLGVDQPRSKLCAAASRNV